MARTLEDRAQSLGFTMSEVEAACCEMVVAANGLDPYQTWNDYYSELNEGVCAVLEENPPANWNEPLWKIKIPYFLAYCEAGRALETLLLNRMT